MGGSAETLQMRRGKQEVIMDKNKDLKKNTEYTSKDKYLLDDDLLDAVSGGATAGKDNGEMGAALWLAERITIDMNGLNPSAWILWQVIEK